MNYILPQIVVYVFVTLLNVTHYISLKSHSYLTAHFNHVYSELCECHS